MLRGHADAGRLEGAVLEWARARDAFCAVPAVKPEDRFPKAIWDRLANAEDALFRLAMEIDDGLGHMVDKHGG